MGTTKRNKYQERKKLGERYRNESNGKESLTDFAKKIGAWGKAGRPKKNIKIQ